MASAAAVAANEANTPPGNDLGQDRGHVGEITDGVYAHDEDLPDANGNADSDDEDLPSNPLRGRKAKRKINGEVAGAEDGDPLDLFGDDEDEAEKPG